MAFLCYWVYIFCCRLLCISAAWARPLLDTFKASQLLCCPEAWCESTPLSWYGWFAFRKAVNMKGEWKGNCKSCLTANPVFILEGETCKIEKNQ